MKFFWKDVFAVLYSLVSVPDWRSPLPENAFFFYRIPSVEQIRKKGIRYIYNWRYIRYLHKMNSMLIVHGIYFIILFLEGMKKICSFYKNWLEELRIYVLSSVRRHYSLTKFKNLIPLKKKKKICRTCQVCHVIGHSHPLDRSASVLKAIPCIRISSNGLSIDHVPRIKT